MSPVGQVENVETPALPRKDATLPAPELNAGGIPIHSYACTGGEQPPSGELVAPGVRVAAKMSDKGGTRTSDGLTTEPSTDASLRRTAFNSRGMLKELEHPEWIVELVQNVVDPDRLLENMREAGCALPRVFELRDGLLALGDEPHRFFHGSTSVVFDRNTVGGMRIH